MAETNGSKTTLSQETKVSLKLVVPFVVAIIGGVLAYADISYSLKDVQRQILELQSSIDDGMKDRWTRTDDRRYMEDFFRENPSLTPVKHRRVTD